MNASNAMRRRRDERPSKANWEDTMLNPQRHAAPTDRTNTFARARHASCDSALCVADWPAEPPSAVPLMALSSGFWAFKTMAAAHDLNLFSLLAGGASTTAAELAEML